MSSPKMLYRSKINFRAYMPPIFFLFCFIGGYFYLQLLVVEYSTTHTSSVGLTIAFLLPISFFILAMIKMNRITWTVFEDRVVIQRSDLLRKAYYYINPEHIYEVTYSQAGLLPKMFGYGSVYIQKTDGNGSYETQHYLSNPRTTTSAIQTIINTYKATVKPAVSHVEQIYAPQALSMIDELEKLIDLKNKGKISEAEYIEFRQKLI